MTIRVLVVDDQELVRAGFTMFLGQQEEIEVVGEAANGAEAVALARDKHPDVVLMDLRMPVMDGIEATKRILSLPTANPIRVLVLTTFDDDESVYAALRAGASGFLLKDIAPRELVAAIRVIAKGEALLSPAVTRRVIEIFAAKTPPSGELRKRADSLTEREREVLTLVARGNSNAEIGAILVLGEATIKTHVSHLLGKLGARDRAQAVAIAYEAGIVTSGSFEA